MKKVLHRSFKPAKCKIALQMAASRLKILKNKKDTQIKHMRRELAQLLESGQTQTAKIRVEQVVREEKTVAAYELVSIYCELVVARLGAIDSQKTCPTDLKESVASVLYASKRLSDVAELADIVKHFTAKYGKDFVAAALGLQSDSGVSRLLVEKLSIKAPDSATKIKILTEIAAEHNVTWKPESLVEADPKDTVSLSGASSSQSAIGLNSESSRIPNNHPPHFQAPAAVNVPHSSYATDERSSSHTTPADHYHQDPRPSGDTRDGREHGHPNPGYGDSSPRETEFVDATSAARAAAESAERASFAARAAAELSSKERRTTMMQDSTESHNSSSYHTSRIEPSHRYNSSSSKQSGSSTKDDILRSSKRQEDKSTMRADSSKNTADELSENTSWRRGHSRDNSFEMRPNDSFAEIGREKKQPSMDGMNLSCSEDVILKKQSSQGSHSSNVSDDNDVTTLEHIESPSIMEEDRFQSTVEDSDIHNHGPDVVDPPPFDEYSSFFDKPQFDTEDAYHDEPQQGLGFSLLGSSSSKPHHGMPTETNSWSFEGQKSLEHPSSASTSKVLEIEKPSSPLFYDGPTSPPTSLHEPEPSAKFDDYERDSESEVNNLNKGILLGHVEEKPKLTSLKSQKSEVSDDLGRYFFPSDTEDQADDSKTQEESDVETPAGFRVGPVSEFKNEETLPPYGMSPPRDKLSSKYVAEHVPVEVDPKSSSLHTVSSSSVRKDLYTETASKVENRPSSIPPDSPSSDDESEMELPKRVFIRNQDKRTESRTRHTHFHSRVSQEDLEEETLTRAPTRSQERRTHKTAPGSGSASYLLSVSSDDEDKKEVRRDTAPIQTKPTSSKFSRRTKGQERRSSPDTAKTDKLLYDQESPLKLIPEAKSLAKQQGSASSSSIPKTDKVSLDQESRPKLISKVKPVAKQQASASSSDLFPKTDKAYQESSPNPVPKTKPAAKQHESASSSAYLPKTNKVSHYQESSPELTPAAKSLAKQEGAASSSSSLPKPVTSPPHPETCAKEKATHVHPKLPDYDDIFAKLGALRR